MATSDAPPIGLTHPTVSPSPSGAPPTRGRSDECACADCEYTVAVDEDLPPKCPECGGALTRVLS